MNKPPRLTLGVKPDHYGLQGWDELHLWLRRNHALAAATIGQAMAHGMSETDTLKLLVDALVAQNHHFMTQALKDSAGVAGINTADFDQPSPEFLEFLDRLYRDLGGINPR